MDDWVVLTIDRSREVGSGPDHASVRTAIRTAFAEEPELRDLTLVVEFNGRHWEEARWDPEQQLAVYTYNQRVRS